jgi:hypothetical protein
MEETSGDSLSDNALLPGGKFTKLVLGLLRYCKAVIHAKENRNHINQRSPETRSPAPCGMPGF